MKRYYVRMENGRLSSLDGPAIRTESGLRQWIVDGRLHRSDGPAVETATGTRLWYWRGVRVQRDIIEHPRRMSPLDILRDPNAEVRRVRMECYGLRDALAVLMEHGSAVVIDEEPEPEPRRLISVCSVEDTDGKRPMYIEVRCPSTGRLYHLRVPPEIKTCREAVAWTFRTTDYHPAIQT